MKTLPTILTIFLLSLLPIFTFGQQIEFYSFSIKTAHAYTCDRQTEVYQKVSGTIKHEATKRTYPHCKKLKKSKLTKDKKIEEQINYLDSLFRLEKFTFIINPSTIDSLKKRTSWKKTYNISDKDIDNFFSHNDTITIELKDIKKGVLVDFVFDGINYWVDLKIKRPEQDTIKYTFGGNFFESAYTSIIKYWLPMYIVNQNHKIFNSIKLVDKYFNDENLENVLFRFIVWTKEK